VHARPAPTLGQHNTDVLGHELGIGADKLAELAREGVIGTRPAGL
jgi:crotonobetainyl-CoA:carnitine CoA-transferase CaiB-like acyl-CoA transferase